MRIVDAEILAPIAGTLVKRVAVPHQPEVTLHGADELFLGQFAHIGHARLGLRGVLIARAIKRDSPISHHLGQTIDKAVAPTTEVAGVDHTPGMMGSHILLRRGLGQEVKDLQVVKTASKLLALHVGKHRGIVDDERIRLVQQVTLTLGGDLLAAEGIEVVDDGHHLGTLPMGESASHVIELLHRILQAQVIAAVNGRQDTHHATQLDQET